MKVPQRIDMDSGQLDALVARVKSGSLQEGDSQIIETMAETERKITQGPRKWR